MNSVADRLSHFFVPLSCKQDAGILTAGEVRKLQEAGYHTCEALGMTTKRELLTVKGIGESKADKILAEGTIRFLHLFGLSSCSKY
jgi:hypothetical protein